MKRCTKKGSKVSKTKMKDPTKQVVDAMTKAQLEQFVKSGRRGENLRHRAYDKKRKAEYRD
jgi:hypothetical protein